MTSPDVSVLMAVRDGGRWLDLAIDSILSQNFGSFELVIVDDGSHDDSVERISSHKNPLLRLLRQPACGLAAALNLGAEACRGRLIARMDADDVAAPDRLASQFAWFANHPETDILCSDAWLIDEHGVTVGRHQMGSWSQSVLHDALLYRRRARPIIHPSVMMRRRLFSQLGGYRDYTCSEDHDFWLRALAAGARFDHIAAPLLSYRLNSNGLSAQRARQESNSMTSAAAAIAFERCGFDAFLDKPDALRACAARLRQACEHDFIPAESACRDVKRLFRAGQILSGAAMLWRGVKAHGWTISPYRRRQQLERLLDGAVNEICALSPIAGEMKSTRALSPEPAP